MPAALPPDRVLHVFRQAPKKPLKAKDVGKALSLPADDRSEVRAALQTLVAAGKLVQLEGKRFVLPGETGGHRGSVMRKASGSGWFIPDDRKLPDAFLPPAELLSVVDGDKVLCRIERGPRGPAGRIVRVLTRPRTTLTGTLVVRGKARFVEVDDNRLSGPVILPEGPEGNAADAAPGDVVEVLLLEAPTAVTTAVGRLVRSLGKRGALDVEVERILADKGVVKAFPPEVIEQAEQHPADPTDDDLQGRTDLRALPLVTIDGETAKDFDDAVHARPVPRSKDLEVTVAIADVSHYVRQGSPLDVEAVRRGTSIYYPGKVVPMLPEALSNGLCSLKPHVVRLCMCTRFKVAPDGQLKDATFFDGAMKSHARLTYTAVQHFLDGAPDAGIGDAAVAESLRHLQEAARRLRAARGKRGSLDFDLPETTIALDDDGEPIKVHALDRLEAHKLIEDLMVAANEAVASHFEARKWPCVYRIHEQPDEEKLGRFLKLARMVAGRGVRIEEDASARSLMAVMGALAEHPAKRALDSLLLRSMKQAKYSADNVGHYGLGSEAYLHFTSPIRRYPDLVVHRLLKDRLSKRPRKKGGDEALLNELEEVAGSCSDRERNATDIERAIDALYCAWFMKDKIGERFPAVVGSVAEFGCFVRLDEHHVEGLVPVQALPPDYYRYDEVRLQLLGERSGRTFGVGDKLEVVVGGVDVARRQVTFSLADVEPRAAAPGAGSERARAGNERPRAGSDRPRAGSDRPQAGAERPRIRGPEDLRRMFDTKHVDEKQGGRGGAAGGRDQRRGKGHKGLKGKPKGR
ncbi:MAG: ribonuclease R [Deltaproteobacteria bacterium]|nr:ribonuclease R [Deltaproteobacteria bacterium]